ncbi:LysR family transcriptional regulator [Halomonas hibernica]|uniref:LysR family transcriptional regulator n=1 Tax=Halomonas hibernica TaxID=2591147 RepID=UPI0015544007|nr:LysR substrate-binding domain-containing protein [Halomonas hibernica]
MFELKQLRYFVAVAEELNFRRAAERLHITQSPLSQTIKNLEEVLDVKLFLRNTHGVQLTRAGEVFLIEAINLLSSARQSLSLVRQADAGEAGSLHIGYSASAIFSPVFTSALATVLEKRPHLTLQLHYGNALDHLSSLRSGHLDAAVLRADIPETATKGLRKHLLGEEPLYVLIHPDHHLAQAHRLFLKDLSNERLLLQPATQQTFLRRQIECLSESAGLSLANALEVPDISSMLCFAMARIGIAVLPKSVAEISSSLVSVPLADIASNCPLILVTASESPVVVALETLIDKKCLDFSLPGKQ